jgi:hypothetical protein
VSRLFDDLAAWEGGRLRLSEVETRHPDRDVRQLVSLHVQLAAAGSVAVPDPSIAWERLRARLPDRRPAVLERIGRWARIPAIVIAVSLLLAGTALALSIEPVRDAIGNFLGDVLEMFDGEKPHDGESRSGDGPHQTHSSRRARRANSPSMVLYGRTPYGDYVYREATRGQVAHGDVEAAYLVRVGDAEPGPAGPIGFSAIVGSIAEDSAEPYDEPAQEDDGDAVDEPADGVAGEPPPDPEDGAPGAGVPPAEQGPPPIGGPGDAGSPAEGDPGDASGGGGEPATDGDGADSGEGDGGGDASGSGDGGDGSGGGGDGDSGGDGDAGGSGNGDGNGDSTGGGNENDEGGNGDGGGNGDAGGDGNGDSGGGGNEDGEGGNGDGGGGDGGGNGGGNGDGGGGNGDGGGGNGDGGGEGEPGGGGAPPP